MDITARECYYQTLIGSYILEFNGIIIFDLEWPEKVQIQGHSDMEVLYLINKPSYVIG